MVPRARRVRYAQDMCGRYATFGPVSLSREAKEVLGSLELDIVSEINQRDDQFNISPTQNALVMASGDNGYKVKPLRWGLIPSWAKDEKIGAKTINARAETVTTKPAFRAAFKKRRCLVPASGYFEWRVEDGGKQPYFIHSPHGHLVMFAGLWEAWRASEADDWTRSSPSSPASLGRSPATSMIDSQSYSHRTSGRSGATGWWTRRSQPWK